MKDQTEIPLVEAIEQALVNAEDAANLERFELQSSKISAALQGTTRWPTFVEHQVGHVIHSLQRGDTLRGIIAILLQVGFELALESERVLAGREEIKPIIVQ